MTDPRGQCCLNLLPGSWTRSADGSLSPTDRPACHTHRSGTEVSRDGWLNPTTHQCDPAEKKRKKEKETKLIKLISKLLFWGCAKHLNTSCCNLIKHIHLFIKIWFSSAWTWDELVVGSKERKKKEPSYWTANVEINLTAACTCVMGMNSPSKLPFKTKFFVVPMSTLSPLPSAIVRMGPNNSGTCREKAAIMHSTASPGT